MAGINEKNYKYLAEAIKSAIEQSNWSDLCEQYLFPYFLWIILRINDKFE